MSESQSFTQYRSKSISQLVQQLNNLGDTHITMQNTTLIGVVDRQMESVRRFRSKSVSRSVSRYGHNEDTGIDRSPNESRMMAGLSEFFLTDGSQKKYYYHSITNQLDGQTQATIMQKFQEGFNTTVVMQYKQERLRQFLQKIEPWFQNANNKYFYASFYEYRAKQAVDLLSGSNPRKIALSQTTQQPQQLYQSTQKSILSSLALTSQPHIKILTLSMAKETSPHLNIILLPGQFFSGTTQTVSPSLKIVKTQISQILNYIKTNPNKKYENINKLLPKRYPTTTVMAELMLYGATCFVVNWVCDSEGEAKGSVVNGRFQFYDKLASVANLVKKVDQGNNKNRHVVKAKKSTSVLKQAKTILKHTNQNSPNNTEYEKTPTVSPVSQLQFCRSLERKTHKYSITPFENVDQTGEALFPDTVALYPPLPQQLNKSESITVLKAQHAREVSQYHQTIQTLNQKLLVVMSEKNMSDIFTIHQREIMLLQLKIQQLRKDIIKICTIDNNPKAPTSKQLSSLKQIIKTQSQQLLALSSQNSNPKATPLSKLSQGKMKMLEKELQEWKTKYQKSETARKELQLELEASANRLRIKDEETNRLYMSKQKTYSDDQLSMKQQSAYKQLQTLLMPANPNAPITISKQNLKYLLQKFKSTLGQVSQLRQIILQCNNFLVDLQEHIETRLMQIDPDVVLDCNKFIRGFLVGTLSVF